MYATYLFTFAAAANVYYKSLCQKELLKSKGTHDQRKNIEDIERGLLG